MSIIVETLADPVYVNAAGTSIDCRVKFAHLSDVVPFTADVADCEVHGREIYRKLVAGDWGPIAPYVPKEPD